MPVGHGPRFSHDAWERCCVDELFRSPVIGMSFHVGDIRDQSGIGLHHPVSLDAHGTVTLVNEVLAPRVFHGVGSRVLDLRLFADDSRSSGT